LEIFITYEENVIIDELAQRMVIGYLYFVMNIHGLTLANRTKPGPSLLV
jgi:hypothetical protein